MQITTRNGLIGIAVDEAFVLEAYPDGEHQHGPFKGKIKWSLGVGVSGAQEGDKQTFEQSMKAFIAAVAQREKELARKLKRKLLPHQFDALMSFYFNNGNRQAMAQVIACLNDGKIDEAIPLWLGSNKAEDKRRWGDKPVPGLVERRKQEVDLFLNGNYGDLSKVKVYLSKPKSNKPDRWHYVTPEDFVRDAAD